MSEVNLVTCGCVVSFIAVAGFYVYLRECWTAEERDSTPQARSVELEDVA
jgi:hypothetical protein